MMNEPFWKPALLQVLLPGLGHFYVKERLFGGFVFLVMLLAALLFAASFFLALPGIARLVMFGLPVFFYLFSFVDLYKIVNNAQNKKIAPIKGFRFFVIAGIVYQLLAPVAMGNFLIINRPEIYRLETTGFAPELSKGSFLIADNLSFQVRFLAFQKVILHAIPERFDIVRTEDANGIAYTGLVIGMPGEDIEVQSGVVVVNGTPDFLSEKSGRLTAGDWPLTRVGNYSMLVAITQTGGIDTVLQVPLDAPIGKVRKLL
jgi:hypothetical protein